MADNLRPSVREMDECSDFCSLRGVDAIDKSSCSMHEYTSNFILKSGWADVLFESTPTLTKYSNQFRTGKNKKIWKFH